MIEWGNANKQKKKKIKKREDNTKQSQSGRQSGAGKQTTKQPQKQAQTQGSTPSYANMVEKTSDGGYALKSQPKSTHKTRQGMTTPSSQPRRSGTNRIKNTVIGAGEQWAAGQLQTASTAHAKVNKGSIRHREYGTDSKYRKSRGTNDRRSTDRNYTRNRVEAREAEQRFNRAVARTQAVADEGSREASRYAYNLEERGQKRLEEAKRGTNKAGRFAVDAAANILQMGMDAATGSTLGSMFTRSLGSGYMQSVRYQQEQAIARNHEAFQEEVKNVKTQDEYDKLVEEYSKRDRQISEDYFSPEMTEGAGMYALGQAGKEVATEKMFNVFSPFAKMYGKGAFSGVEEAAEKKLAATLIERGVSKEIAEKIARGGLGATSEGLEEVMSDIGEYPLNAIMEKVYGKQFGDNPTLQDMAYDFAIGGTVAAVMGGGANIANTLKTGGMKAANLDEDSKYKVLEEAQNLSEDSEAYQRAVQLMQQEEAGLPVWDSDIYQLDYQIAEAKGAEIQELEQKERQYRQQKAKEDQEVAGDTSRIAQDAKIETESEFNALNEIVADNVKKTSEIVSQAFQARGYNASEDPTMGAASESIGRILTGTATTDDFTVGLTVNPVARQIIQDVTGIQLPATNDGTRKALRDFTIAARVNNEDAFVQQAKEMAEADFVENDPEMKSFREEGGEVYDIVNEALPSVSAANRSAFMSGVSRYASGGMMAASNGNRTFYETVNRLNKDYHQVVPENVRRAVFDAAYRKQEGKQKKVAGSKQVKSKKTKGKVTFETQKIKTNEGKEFKSKAITAKETKEKLGNDTFRFLKGFAEATGREINFFSLPNSKVNGTYHNGVIHINIDAENPLNVLLHEVTHDIQKKSPKEYEKLKRFVFDTLYESDADAYNAKIDAKIRGYEKAGQILTREEAEDEILADATDVMLRKGEEFQKLIDYDKSLAERLLDGLRNLLKTLHDLLNRYPSARTGHFLEDLGILEDAEKMWVEALNASVGVEGAVDESGMNFSLDGYSDHQKSNWKNSKRIVIYTGKPSLRSFINQARIDKSFNKKMYFGMVGEELANEIQKRTGVNVKGRNVSLSGSEIRKILKDHGDVKKEALRGQRAITIDDILEIPNIIQNPNIISPSNKTYMGRPALLFEAFAPKRTIVVGYDSANRNDLIIQTMYGWEKEKSLSTPTDEQASINTPEANSGTAFSNNTVPNSEQNVKGGKFSISPEQQETLNDKGVNVTESGTVTKFSLTSWMNDDQEQIADTLVEAGFDRDIVERWIDDVNGVASIIAQDKMRLDYTPDEFQDFLKKNSEYYFTLDGSTLCKKRRVFQGTYNAVMHKLKSVPLLADDVIRLRRMLDDAGYDVPCGICYEESRKKHEGEFAERWLNGHVEKGKVKWKGYANMDHKDPYIPTLDDVTTTDGRERLRREGHTEALESYLEYQRTRGSANPKVSFTHTDYRGEIRKLTKKDIENLKHIGGLRIQSFSDFESPQLIDMMQAILDMSAKKLTSQAYTKVPDFAWAFGDTGIKINLSLIGSVKDGKLVFDSKEGIDPDEAFRLRERYSKNVGTIIVGANKESILAAWADPRIDMVIPFHRSGWSTAEFEKLGLGDYKDFQEFQSERYLDGSPNGISLKKAKMEELYSADYWDFSKTGKENAEEYLRLCAEQKRRPVFYNFLHDNGDGSWSLQEDGSTDGYWKSLVDFKMYDNDGVGSPQTEVTPNINMEEANRILNEYEGGADTLPVAEDIVDKFVDDMGKRQSGQKFSISTPVEQVKDLIAVHNLKEDDLRGALDLGGFPMPSIAVTKDSMGHDMYGDITLMFHSDTINPKKSRKNKVYGGDAYTPTFPAIEVKPNDKVASRIGDLYYDLSKKIGYDETRPLYNYVNDLERVLNNAGGEAELIAQAKDDTSMMRMFLKMNDKDVEDVVKETQTTLSDAEIGMNEHFIKTLGKDVVKSVYPPNGAKGKEAMDYRRQWVKEHKSALEDAYASYLKSLNDAIFTDELIEDVVSDTKAFDYMKMIRNAANYIKNGATTTKTEVDREATEKAVRDAAQKSGYDEWVDSLLKGIVAGKGIRNNKDVFTRSGNRRSWDALHDPVTLESVVKSMSSVLSAGGNGIFGANPKGAAQKEYGSLDEIRADKDRLQMLPEDEYERLGQEALDKFIAVCQSIYRHNESKFDMPIGGAMEIGEAIAETLNQTRTKTGIQKELRKWWTVSDSEMNDLMEAIDAIANVPTGYFEAKPQRAVGFDEVRAAILPESLSDDLKKNLRNQGVNVYEYDTSKEGDRADKVNQAADEQKVKFSIAPESKVDRDNEKLRKKIDSLKGEFRLSKVARPEEAQTNKAISELIKVYSDNKMDNRIHTQVKEHVDAMFGEIHKSDPDWYAVEKHAVEAARQIAENSGLFRDENKQVYEELKGLLTGTKIHVTDEMYQDLGGKGKYAEYQKSASGTLRLSRTSGTEVEEFYQDLVKQYPHLFDAVEVEKPADQIRHIMDVMNDLKPYYESYEAGEMKGVVTDIALDLMDMINGLKMSTTFADRKKAEKDRAVAKLKKRYEKRLADQKAKLKEDAEKVTAERNDLIERQKASYKERLDKKDKYYKQKIADIRKKYADKKSRSYYTERIKARSEWLSDRLLRPTDTKHIPQGMQEAIAEMLYGFDFSTPLGDKWEERHGRPSRRTLKFANLRKQYDAIIKSNDSRLEGDEDLANAIAELGKYENRRFADLETEELAEVYDVLKKVLEIVRNANRTFNDNIKENISGLGEDVIGEMKAVREDRVEGTGWWHDIMNFLNESNVNPTDFFTTLGGTMEKLYHEMRMGFDQFADNVNVIKGFTEDLREQHKDLKKWTGDKAKTQKFRLDNGQTVEMTPAQVMSLYCSMKRPQARQHILTSGFAPSPQRRLNTLGQRLTKNLFAKGIQSNVVMPSYDDIQRIIGSLTDEQKAVADKVQEFMNTTCAEWGNEVSMKMYGYNKFTEKTYFPIRSSDQFIAQSFDKKQPSKLKNASMTKTLEPTASNPIVMDDIFSVLTDHGTTMAQYNGLVPAITDFERVMNYKQWDDQGRQIGTVRQALEGAYGKHITRYIDNFMSDLNQNYTKISDHTLMNKMLANAKKGSLGLNIRVLLQQPTAIFRAYAVIDPKYTVSAKSINIPKNMKEMHEKNATARWKSWGFFNTDVSKDMYDILMGNKGLEHIASEAFMGSYGKADDCTWAVIWQTVKNEINATRPELVRDTPEYWQAVNERFDYVVDRTQVVDTPFHRSQIMRRQDMFTKLITAFMAEPTKTYNMCRTELILAWKAHKDGDNAQAAARITRVSAVFVANTAATAFAAGLIDIMRDAINTWDDKDDEEDDKDFWQKLVDHARDNAIGNTISMLPLVSDIASIFQGYDVNRMDLQAITQFKKALDTMQKENIDPMEKIKTLSKAFSYLTGIPVFNIMRDGQSFYTTVVEHLEDADRAKYEAYSMRYKVGSEKNLSRFMGIYKEALFNGNDETAEYIKKDMIEHGYSEEDINERMARSINEIYRERIKEAASGGDAKSVTEAVEWYQNIGYGDKDPVEYGGKQILDAIRDSIKEGKEVSTISRYIKAGIESGLVSEGDVAKKTLSGWDKALEDGNEKIADATLEVGLNSGYGEKTEYTKTGLSTYRGFLKNGDAENSERVLQYMRDRDLLSKSGYKEAMADAYLQAYNDAKYTGTPEEAEKWKRKMLDGGYMDEDTWKQKEDNLPTGGKAKEMLDSMKETIQSAMDSYDSKALEQAANDIVGVGFYTAKSEHSYIRRSLWARYYDAKDAGDTKKMNTLKKMIEKWEGISLDGAKGKGYRGSRGGGGGGRKGKGSGGGGGSSTASAPAQSGTTSKSGGGKTSASSAGVTVSKSSDTNAKPVSSTTKASGYTPTSSGGSGTSASVATTASLKSRTPSAGTQSKATGFRNYVMNTQAASPTKGRGVGFETTSQKTKSRFYKTRKADSWAIGSLQKKWEEARLVGDKKAMKEIEKQLRKYGVKIQKQYQA